MVACSLAAYWWLWFEADESGVHAQRRNVVVALLAVISVAGALKLLKVLLPFRYRPLNDPDLGLRLPFGVDPSLNHFSAFPSGHAMLFFALCVPLWMRSRWLGVAAAVWTLLAICLPLLHRRRPLGKRHRHWRRGWRGAHAPTVPAYRRHGAARSSGALQCNASPRVLRHCVAGRP